ncbi:hypothetical protein [Aeromonas media]|uniref:hypothetical protein n=1 Tax=Aeromonas media TaxID=651 RepID=UPI0015DD2A4C|nr:hypothetical protein [Aeromonas media]BBS86487.1 hypothetical protein WP7W18E02_13840 [Aeromonas media]
MREAVTKEWLLEKWDSLHLPIYSDGIESPNIAIIEPIPDDVKDQLAETILKTQQDPNTHNFFDRAKPEIEPLVRVRLLVTLAACLNPALYATKESMRLGHDGRRTKPDHLREVETVIASLERELDGTEDSELTFAAKRLLGAYKNARSRIHREFMSLGLYAHSARELLNQYMLPVDDRDERWLEVLGQLWGVSSSNIRGAFRKIQNSPPDRAAFLGATPR